ASMPSGIRARAEMALFLAREGDDSHGAFQSRLRVAKRAQRFREHCYSDRIVQGSRRNVDGVDVRMQEENLLGELATRNFCYHIVLGDPRPPMGLDGDANPRCAGLRLALKRLVVGITQQ